MKFEKVSDVLALCEDTDIIRLYNCNDWPIAAGKWYEDHILAKSEEAVTVVRFENVGMFAAWRVKLKGV